jgi:hypothetical protein
LKLMKNILHVTTILQMLLHPVHIQIEFFFCYDIFSLDLIFECELQSLYQP